MIKEERKRERSEHLRGRDLHRWRERQTERGRKMGRDRELIQPRTGRQTRQKNGERQRTDTAMNKVESKLDLSAEKGGRWHFKNGASGDSWTLRQ